MSETRNSYGLEHGQIQANVSDSSRGLKICTNGNNNVVNVNMSYGAHIYAPPKSNTNPPAPPNRDLPFLDESCVLPLSEGEESGTMENSDGDMYSLAQALIKDALQERLNQLNPSLPICDKYRQILEGFRSGRLGITWKGNPANTVLPEVFDDLEVDSDNLRLGIVSDGELLPDGLAFSWTSSINDPRGWLGKGYSRVCDVA